MKSRYDHMSTVVVWAQVSDSLRQIPSENFGRICPMGLRGTRKSVTKVLIMAHPQCMLTEVDIIDTLEPVESERRSQRCRYFTLTIDMDELS